MEDERKINKVIARWGYQGKSDLGDFEAGAIRIPTLDRFRRFFPSCTSLVYSLSKT